MQRNLLTETLETLAGRGKGPEDVRWVGTPTHYQTWNEFAAAADREYEASYDAPEVAQDLLVVGEDWWLERHEYDGSEWWEFKTVPKLTLGAVQVPGWQPFIHPRQIGWGSFQSINCWKEGRRR